MSESIRTPEEVTVIFRQDESLIVPDSWLQTETRHDDETFERTAYRLSRSQGVDAHVDHFVPTSHIENAPRAYVMMARKVFSEIIGTPVHKDGLLDHIENHPGLTHIEKEIFKSATTHVFGITSPGQTA